MYKKETIENLLTYWSKQHLSSFGPMCSSPLQSERETGKLEERKALQVHGNAYKYS